MSEERTMVEKGAKWLDANYKGDWRSKIDKDKLNDCRACITGQLYAYHGSYSGYNYFSSKCMQSIEDRKAHGFATDTGNLQKAWLEYLNGTHINGTHTESDFTVSELKIIWEAIKDIPVNLQLKVVNVFMDKLYQGQ